VGPRDLPGGYTPLHWAGIRAQWSAFVALLEAGADPNAVGDDGGTPLHWACHHDRPDMVAKLLDAGALLDVHNQWGRTPLHVAARRGCLKVAALLLERGAEVGACTDEGWTSLHVAYRADHPAVVELLLAHGADPEALDDHGKRPSQHVTQRPAAVEMAPERLRTYVGEYDLGGGFHFEVWLEDDRLWLRDYASDQLYPVGPDSFHCRQEPWNVRFLRDRSGEVRAIEVDFLRRTVSGTRRPLSAPRSDS
jgi:hypothetical protein